MFQILSVKAKAFFLFVLVIVFLCICLAVLKTQWNPAKVSSSGVCTATVEDDVGAGLHYGDFQSLSQGPSLAGQYVETCLLAPRVCSAGGCSTRHTFFFRDFHLFSETKSKYIFLKLR